ncbi:MAG: imidazole glycerol phosphate synthase subunit HisH [Candidatus Omnitrophota bacterium]
MKSVAIIDYGLGNIFSVKHACEYCGMKALVTNAPRDIQNASAIILPGVGAFGKALADLKAFDLEGVLIEEIKKGKPFIGICLGMQLLMTQSHEFGQHKGLDIITGSVLPLREKFGTAQNLKVPHIGWNAIFSEEKHDRWGNTLLSGIPQGTSMYFVHSFYCAPENNELVLSRTEYGGFRFATAIQSDNVYGFQFHPERSGASGIAIYQNLSKMISRGGAS